MTKESDGKLLVTTRFPSRNLFTRPFRGKTNLKLVYKIKAPRRSVLDIDHDRGVVSVTGTVPGFAAVMIKRGSERAARLKLC